MPMTQPTSGYDKTTHLPFKGATLFPDSQRGVGSMSDYRRNFDQFSNKLANLTDSSEILSGAERRDDGEPRIG